MSQAKNAQASFKNIPLWINERFPVPVMVYAGILFLLCIKFGRLIYGSPQPFGFFDWIGALVGVTVFLLIRILDEHKDYKEDNDLHRDRVLQRGLISLTHLKWIGVFCVGAQLAYIYKLDPSFGLIAKAWIAMVLWLAVMTKEFFIAEWLRKRLFLYALLHMAIMVFMSAWFVQCALPQHAIGIEIWPICLVVFLSGFSAEIIRKTKSPDEERESVDSYSKIFGLKGSSCLVLALIFAINLVLLGMLNHVFGTWISLSSGLISSFFLIPLIAILSFMIKPTIKGRKINEMSVGFYMLLAYGAFILGV